jgi:hypothetical protein
MKCSVVLAEIGFECKELQDGVTLINTPFTFGEDGELISLHIVELGQGKIKITDAGYSVYHLASMGIKLNAGRVSELNTVIQMNSIEFDDNGEISVVCENEYASYYVPTVVKSVIAASTLGCQWSVKNSSKDFKKEVGAFLKGRFKRKLETNFSVTGRSGHQLEFPFVIRGDNGLVYIQPVGRRSGQLNWDRVYSTHGKMTDIHRPDNERIVFVDDVDVTEIQRAQAFLEDTAKVVPYSSRDQWANTIKVA